MNYRKAHFIGLGGIGMSAVAKLLKDSGVFVSGSDEEIYPPASDFIEKEGFEYYTPYKAKNIPKDADLIVIGKNAKLTAETNEEVATAFSSGKKEIFEMTLRSGRMIKASANHPFYKINGWNRLDQFKIGDRTTNYR